jgi:hypothetical protein
MDLRGSTARQVPSLFDFVYLTHAGFRPFTDRPRSRHRRSAPSLEADVGKR